MNRRGKRLTLGVMVVGVAVVVVLAIAHWKAVCDHVEAWRFQLTRETMTVPSNPSFCVVPLPACLCFLAHSSGQPVIFDPNEGSSHAAWRGRLIHRADHFPNNNIEVWLNSVTELGFRVLEQRFPRRAYVVIRDEQAEEPTANFLLPPFSAMKTTPAE